jgi:spermidine synthase
MQHSCTFFPSFTHADRHRPAVAGSSDHATGCGRVTAMRRLPAPVIGMIVFLTSAAILVLEIVAARLLAPYVGVTLQTYTAIIGVILSGIAAGAWLGGRLADRTNPAKLVGPVLIVGGVCALVEIPLLRYLGPKITSTRASAVIGLTASVFLLPATVLSTVSPLLTKVKLTDLDRTGRTVGGLSALSTAGALVGSFVTGFVLVPHFRSRVIVGIVGATLMSIGVLVTTLLRDTRPSVTSSVIVAVGLVAAAGAGATEAASSWKDPCQMESSYFCARVQRELADNSKRLLILDDGWHSKVDIDDPTYLEFEYVRAFRIAIDAWRPPPTKLRALHIGGGGFTMPRYLKATRPGTDSLVLEVDAKLVAFDKKQLGLELARDLRTTSGDGRQNLRRQPSHSWDLVVGDAFGGQSVPWHLATREVALDVQRVLARGGLYVLNVIDNPPQRFIKAEIKTVQSVFPHVAVMSYPDAFAGTIGANFVVVASDRQLPSSAMRLALKADFARTGMVLSDGTSLQNFVGSTIVLTDEFGPVDQLFTR